MFDEFQEIEKLGGAALEKQLRAAIQSHHRVNYVFAEIWDTLTLYQQKLLKAIAQSGVVALTSVRHIRRYELQSSSSVARGLKLLQQKGLIDKENDHYVFTDIFFEKWVTMGRR